jgi:hypothetical protein
LRLANPPPVSLTSECGAPPSDDRVICAVLVSISYQSDIDRARAVLLELVEQRPSAREHVACRASALASSSVDLSLLVWCADAGTAAVLKAESLEALAKPLPAAAWGHAAYRNSGVFRSPVGPLPPAGGGFASASLESIKKRFAAEGIEIPCAWTKVILNRIHADEWEGNKRRDAENGERFPQNNSRIEPLNLIEKGASVVGRSVAALPFGAFRFSGLPAGEIGSGRRHTYCLVTPLSRCSRWGGLSFRRRPGARRLASVVNPHLRL